MYMDEVNLFLRIPWFSYWYLYLDFIYDSSAVPFSVFFGTSPLIVSDYIHSLKYSTSFLF
jgi:hypothetical protein